MAGERWTPGPWRAGGILSNGSISIGSDEFRIVIAEVTNAASFGDFMAAALRGRLDFGAPDTAETQWANVRLISAAPDIYAALEQAAELIRHHLGDQSSEDGWKNDEIRDAWLAARAAMAKARGET